MAHIKSRDLQGGRRAHLVRWVDAAGRERSKQFKRKTDATAFKVEIERELLRGTYVDPRMGEITFRRYAEQWRADRVDHRPATAERVRADLARYAYPVIGDLRMGAARRPDLQRLVHSLVHERNLAPATVRTVMGNVGAVFTAAVEDRLIAVNPCIRLSLPKPDAGEVAIPTDDELAAILAGFGASWYRRLVATAAGTGLRSGEIRGLTEDRVDWLRRTVKVDRQLVGVTGDGMPIFGPPKTPASTRVIPVAKSVIDVLAEQLADRGPGPEGIIFTGRGTPRQPMRKAALHHALNRVYDPLDWPTGTGMHLFRHYYASLLIHKRASVKVVQARLGHASSQETLDTYGHLWPDDEETSRTAVEEVLGPIIAGAAAGPSQVRESVSGPSPHTRKVAQSLRRADRPAQVAGSAGP